MGIVISAHSTAVDLLAALAARDVSSVELLELYIARIERHNGALNAVVALDADGARRAARNADTARLRGDVRGALHGLPVTVKDALLTRGLPTSAGAIVDAVPGSHDAASVARLRAAGAIVFGKTNVPSWSGDTQTSNDVFGRTNNPWDLNLSPGGSSGGAAAAVAAGLTAADLGTDIGGSIRVPAAYCGIAGHKPSQGVVSTLGNVVFSGSENAERDLEVVGPLGRSVADLVLLCDVLFRSPGAGNRPRSARPLVRKLAAWFGDDTHPLDAAVRDVLDDSVARLRDGGFVVDEASRPAFFLDSACDVIRRIAADEFGAAGTSALARPTSATRTVLDSERLRLRASWDEFCADYDAVLCPVSATTATPHDGASTSTRLVDIDATMVSETSGLSWCTLTTGLHAPATVLPAGLSREGLPVGFMVTGACLDDWTVLAAAREIERVLPVRAIPSGYADP